MANDGYVHLDCKPDNVVMGVPPRLIDLSIARTVERAARSRGPLGTAAYQAPEQCGDESAPDPIGPPADAWGLGATLFHAVSGRTPFGSGSRKAKGAERYPQLAEEPRPLPDHLPEGVRELLSDLLAKDPAARPTCAEAIERLEPIIANLPSTMTFSRRGAL
jgi:serine/threonine protein kinase